MARKVARRGDENNPAAQIFVRWLFHGIQIKNKMWAVYKRTVGLKLNDPGLGPGVCQQQLFGNSEESH